MLTPGSHINASASELALLIGMVAVFVAGLIAVNFFEKRHRRTEPSGVGDGQQARVLD